MNNERKQWLKEQLDKFSECQLFNFGSSDGFDIHSDVVDLLAENKELSDGKETEVHTSDEIPLDGCD